jgi:hypothetical protein
MKGMEIASNPALKAMSLRIHGQFVATAIKRQEMTALPPRVADGSSAAC